MIIRIIAIFIAVLCATTGLSYSEDTTNDTYFSRIDCDDNAVPKDYTSLSNYICNNLELLAKAINQEEDNEDICFNATYCEERIPVYVISLDVNGIYLDFNGNNGYMIVVDDGVVAFESKGDLAYLKGLDKCYYSLSDKFVYYDTMSNIVPYEPNPVLSSEELEKIVLEKKYSGQEQAGEGTIDDPDLYVKDKYGSGYSVIKSNSLYRFEYVRQANLSIYYEIKNGVPYSEGNCVLSSIYALMNYLQSTGKYLKLPASSKKTSYDATKDAFYKTYASKSNYSIETPKELPNLYLSIRKYAVNNYGYKVSSVFIGNIEDIIKGVAKEYGYKLIKTNHILVWTYEGQVVSEINSGYPTLWNCINSSTYNNHTLVVTGYKQYRKITKIFGIKFYKYVNLMQVNDNWKARARYYDFTSYANFGTFVKVR